MDEYCGCECRTCGGPVPDLLSFYGTRCGGLGSDPTWVLMLMESARSLLERHRRTWVACLEAHKLCHHIIRMLASLRSMRVERKLTPQSDDVCTRCSLTGIRFYCYCPPGPHAFTIKSLSKYLVSKSYSFCIPFCLRSGLCTAGAHTHLSCGIHGTGPWLLSWPATHP